MANEEADAGGFDPTDPYNRQAQTFPQLSAEQLRRMEPFGEVMDVPAGATLFRRGERSVDFFVVLDGAVEIVDPGAPESEAVIHVHRSRGFTGELDLFNDREILVSGRTARESRILRVPRPHFHRLIQAEPDIGEIIMRAFILRRVALMKHAQGGVVLLGSMHNADMLRLEQFLSRNGYPHRTIDTDVDQAGGGLVRSLDLQQDLLPVVVLQDQRFLRRPSNAELADALGLTEARDPERVYDLAVVGAGPAGLAAAVYGASEGLATIVVEALAPRGQAATSSKIENYLGFPTGISGRALAGRAQVQAQKFGARLAISRRAAAIRCDAAPFRIELEDGQNIGARSIVSATGARYRKLELPDYDRFEGQGIHYAATWIEGNLCANEEVIVVGGGNSAGQAAVFLSGEARHVHILVRGGGLAATMSDYLIQRIEASPKITLHPYTEITRLEGEQSLERVTWTHRHSGESETRNIANLFVMIGAEPNTDWLEGCVPLDRGGFVVTGRDGDGQALISPYQTERPGIFAVGDVRSGSTKRVAPSVGGGSVVISAVHAYLADVEKLD